MITLVLKTLKKYIECARTPETRCPTFVLILKKAAFPSLFKFFGHDYILSIVVTSAASIAMIAREKSINVKVATV